MSTSIQQITADELLIMPNNNMRRELVAGELREMAPSGQEHGCVAMMVSISLGGYIEEHKLGKIYAAETGFHLETDPDTVRAPDFAFVSREHLASVQQGRGFFPGPPDLAVEVISPSDTYSEVEEKVEEWLNAGCRMVVVVNPRNRTLKVYRTVTDITVLTVEDTFDGADVVPGFQLLVRRIFSE